MTPRTPFAAALAMLVVGSTLAAQAWGPMTIGPVTAAPGTTASGTLAVPAGSDSATTIPISIVRGAQAGPTLVLVAGTHGAEVAPVVALQRVRAMATPATMTGTLVLVHVANMPSFMHRTVYRGPWDRKNLNRVYPGRADGTVSERIAHVVTTQLIARADYLVDMHAGDGNESLRPYLYWSRLGLDVRVDSLAREMALAWGADHIVVDDERSTDPARSLYTQNTAQVRGIPAITTEAGWLGVPDESMVARNVDGVFRLARCLGIAPGACEKATTPVWLEGAQVLTSPVTGTFHATVQRSEYVAQGAIVGRVTDFAGRPLAEIRAPFAGVVLYVIGSPAMAQGEPVAFIGRVRTEGMPPVRRPSR
jgi:predicted deacylase